jgi:hypothetical protein
MDSRTSPPPRGRIRRNPAPRILFPGNQRMRQQRGNQRQCQQHHYYLLSWYVQPHGHRGRHRAQSFEHNDLYAYGELRRSFGGIAPPETFPSAPILIFTSSSQQNAESCVYTSASLPMFQAFRVRPGCWSTSASASGGSCSRCVKEETAILFPIDSRQPTSYNLPICRCFLLFHLQYVSTTRAENSGSLPRNSGSPPRNRRGINTSLCSPSQRQSASCLRDIRPLRVVNWFNTVSQPIHFQDGHDFQTPSQHRSRRHRDCNP